MLGLRRRRKAKLRAVQQWQGHVYGACMRCLACLLLWVGCATSGELRAGEFRKDAVHYRIDPPGADWEQLTLEDENDLAWFHRGWAALIQVNASCSAEQDIPLRALRHHLLIGFTDVQLDEEEERMLDGRAALHTPLQAKLDGVPRRMLLTVMKKNGCAFDFALIMASSSPAWSQAEQVYEKLLQHFHTEGRLSS